jgi:hypothetical protein
VKELKVQVGLAREQFPGCCGLPFALCDEVHVVPTGKEVEFVPLGAAVAQKYEIRHGSSVALASGNMRGDVASDRLLVSPL